MKVVSSNRSTRTSTIHTRTPASSPPDEAERRHQSTRPHRSSDRVVELAMVQQQPGRDHLFSAVCRQASMPKPNEPDTPGPVIPGRASSLFIS